MKNIIELKKVSKKYGNKTILSDVSIDIKDGERIAIVGKSGVGKSILMRLISGLEAPTSGEALILYKESMQNIEKLSKRKLSSLLSVLFQSSALIDSINVKDNILFHLPKNKRNIKFVEEKLSQVGLPLDTWSKFPSELSGGMQKRVAMARLIAREPKVIIFDEPTSGLDPVTSATINQLINDTTKKLGSTALIVTHDKSTALTTSDRIIHLDSGVIASNVSTDDVRNQSTSAQSINDFLNGKS